MEKTILTYIADVPTLKEQILDIMTEWENDAQQDVERLNRDYVNSDDFKRIIDKLVMQRIIELFNDNRFMHRLYNTLEVEGFERNCIGCLMVDKHYGKMN